MSESSGYSAGTPDGTTYVNCPQPPQAQPQGQYEVYSQSNYVQQPQHHVVIGNYGAPQQSVHHQTQQQFVQQRDFRPQQHQQSPQQQQHVSRQFHPQMQHNSHRYRHPPAPVRVSKAEVHNNYQNPTPRTTLQQRPVLLNSAGQRLVKIPQGNIRLVVQPRRTLEAPSNDQRGGVYLKPGGPAPVQLNGPPLARMPQVRPAVRMIMQQNRPTNSNNSPRPASMITNHQGVQQNNWNQREINTSANHYQNQVQQPQQFVNSHSPQNEIAYNVEHIFMENGNEVKKMPIKFGDKTVWVDCVPSVTTENREDQVVFDLLEGDQSLMSPPPPGATPGGSCNSQSQSRPANNSVSPQESNSKFTGSQEDRDKIVKAVLDDLISPAELSVRHGVSVTKIRDWVKATGNKLPSKYRVKNEKIKNNGQNPPASPQIQPKQAQMPNPPQQPAYNNSMNLGHESPGTTVVRPPVHFQSPPTSRHSLEVQGPHVHVQSRPPSHIQANHQQKLILPQKGPSETQNPNITLTNSSAALMCRQVIISKPASLNIEQYKPKLVPGKLALCKNCGSTSPDFNKCIRCKKPLPESCKVIDDPNVVEKGHSNSQSTSVTVELSPKTDLRGVRIQPKQKKKTSIPEEPECIALSSDEEGGEEENNEEEDMNKEEDGECLKNGIEEPEKDISKDKGNEGEDPPTPKDEDSVVDDPITGDYITLTCRSVRIGSYKSIPRDKVIFTEKGLRLVVPSIKDPSVPITIDIKKGDIMQFLAHFGRGMPIFFLFVSISACKRTRDQLKMDSNQGFWLDITSSDETQKRITILPDKMNDDAKHILLRNYGHELVKELGSKEANDILVRSSPKDNIVFRMAHFSSLNKPPGQPHPNSTPVPSIKYCTFPPSSRDSVTVSTEDYYVLEDESFLNDVIIDFYCRYLQYKIFNENDRQRTHIFSTFFYNRLTSRPKKIKNKLHPVEDNPNLSAAEKRYERVKRWTKKVNLFDKDFIIIPINEHSHWFVAIICYPGQIGCRRMDNNESVDPQVLVRNPNRKSNQPRPNKRIVQIGSTTIIPLKPEDQEKPPVPPEEDMSDRDEADASDDEMMDEEPSQRLITVKQGEKSEETPPSQETSNCEAEHEKEESSKIRDDELHTKDEGTNEKKQEENEPKERIPIKQPCILIFDSLATGSRARVAATLRDYLMCEHKAKMGEVREFTKENMMGHCPKVPQQPNFSDCGIFLLQYVESFFHSPISDYHLPITNLKNWFPTDIVRNKRYDIAKIIRKLAEEQNPGKKLAFPNINFLPSAGSGYTDDEMEEEEEIEEEEEYDEEEEYYMGEEEEEEGLEEEESAIMDKSELVGGEPRTLQEEKKSCNSSNFVVPQGYVLSKTGGTIEIGSVPSVKIIPNGGPSLNRKGPEVLNKNNVNSVSVSPDSTSANEEDLNSSHSLVDYSDSGSDETPPVPNSSHSIEARIKRPHSLHDEIHNDSDDGSKKTKYDS